MTNEKTLPAIRKKVTLNAPIEKVWQAVSSSKGIEAWFMPNTFKAEAGHEFILKAGPFGDSKCKVTAIEAPYHLAFDWDKDWHVTFDLKALSDNKTEFTLVHSGWHADEVTRFNQEHKKIRDTMAGGWEKIVGVRLPAYVEDSHDS